MTNSHSVITLANSSVLFDLSTSYFGDFFQIPFTVFLASFLNFFLSESSFNDFCALATAIDNYYFLGTSAIYDFEHLSRSFSVSRYDVAVLTNSLYHLDVLFSSIYSNIFLLDRSFVSFRISEETFSMLESFRLFLFAFSFWIFLFVFVYYTYLNLFSGSVLSRSNSTSLFHESYVSSTLEEAEKELSAIDDSAVFIGYFISMYGWFFFSVVTPFELGSTLIHSLILMLIFVVCMPLSTFYDYGACFFVYLRGASASTFFTLELLYDCLTTAIVITRLLVQSLRFVLMFVGYFELVEFLYQESWFTFLHWNYNLSIHPDYMNPSALNDLVYASFVILPNFLLFCFYYLGHLLFVLISQFCAFFMLVFWLFSFLYTYFNSDVFERHFNIKRKSYKKGKTSIK